MVYTASATPVYVNQMPSTSRVNRRPQHSFQIRHKAYAIQPFLLAPVLPGETMKNLLLQSRVVTDPIKNPIVGWWLEYYIFYVKHRDLAARDLLQDMMLTPGTDVSSLKQTSSANAQLYTAVDSIKWADMCLSRVVEEYFRDEGEAVSIATVGGLPSASINQHSWLDSVTDATLMPDDQLVDEAGTATLDASDLELRLLQYEHLRALKLVNMSYEDWLRTFGVRSDKIETHRSELLRYVREWQYPSNTIDPSSGVPRSAVSWSVAERADKDRFFTEPGFIFGVTLARPKVYLRAQKGSAAGFLDDALAWLPAVLQDRPEASLKTIDNTDDLITTTNGFVVDMRDLFIYGDQFVNWDVSADLTASTVNLPLADLTNKRYPSEDDAEDLFVDDTDASGLTNVKQDGVVHLTIAGRQVDHT